MDGGPRTSWSVVLPCFEEADLLERLVAEIGLALHDVGGGDHEILLVCSREARDGTPETARRLARSGRGIRCVEQDASDGGYGRAVALGIETAVHDGVLLMDADGQFDPADLPRLAALAASGAAVLGFRAPRRDPWPRRLAGRGYTLALDRLLGLGGVIDLDCALKLMPAAPLRRPPLASRTGVVNAEIVLRLRAGGVRIVQAPVSHRERRLGRSRYAHGVPLLGEVPRANAAAALLRDAWGLLRAQASTRPRSA